MNTTEKFLPMDSAPKDGTLVRLLVEFEANSIDDGEGPFATIGANNYDNDGQDRWQFVGWCWRHDHFTDGTGKPVGWLPMLTNAASEAVLAEFKEMEQCLVKESQRYNALWLQFDCLQASCRGLVNEMGVMCEAQLAGDRDLVQRKVEEFTRNYVKNCKPAGADGRVH
ncbi:hypothetical protein N5E30_05820 [Pseudomonas chengduensis]|nr:hypothetical protein [Pseudomonas chengduensis]MDH1681100.1 hypothetical protein [Pseudomonas chengduensis]